MINRTFLALLLAALGIGIVAQTQAPKLDIPTNMKPYFMVYMLKGPKAVAPGTPEYTKEMGAHLAWMKKMNAEKKLILAGPMQGEGRVLGISVLNAANIEEAKKLMATEPAIVSGHMVYEIQACYLPDLGGVKMEYEK